MDGWDAFHDCGAHSGHSESSEKASLIYAVGIKFRIVGWITLITLFITGLFNLSVRGMEFSGSFWINNLGKLAVMKISVFILIVTVSVVHDNVIGTRTIELMQNNPESAEAERYRNWAKQMGRIIFLLGIIAMSIGIVIVRGCI